MSEPTDIAADTERETRHPGFTLWLWALFVAFVVYPLSIGPVAKASVHFNNGRAPRPVVAMYAPLGYVIVHVPGAHDFFDWYGKLWGVNF
jgi:hypothetical protein